MSICVHKCFGGSLKLIEVVFVGHGISLFQVDVMIFVAVVQVYVRSAASVLGWRQIKTQYHPVWEYELTGALRRWSQDRFSSPEFFEV